MVRVDGDDLLETASHIHDFPVLWYADAAGLVYVVAPGAVVDPARVADMRQGVGVFFDPAALDGDGAIAVAGVAVSSAAVPVRSTDSRAGCCN